MSSSGTLVYYLGSPYSQRELAWVDHDGRSTQLAGRPQLGLDSPAISPDGRRVAVVAYEKENADIWVHDLARGTRSRLVAGPQDELLPMWSPSGDRIFCMRTGNNVSSKLMEIPADGTGAPRIRVEESSGDVFSLSPDGQALIFSVEKAGLSSLWRLDLNGNATPVRLTPNTSVDESESALSPDGRWLAYQTDEAGPLQVFVRRFPDGGQKQQVSLNGGSFPFWAAKGTAILYWEGDTLMEVPVQSGAALTIDTARKMFSAGDVGMVASDASAKPALDLAADGRFLVVRRSSDDPRRGILVVENWMEEFRKR